MISRMTILSRLFGAAKVNAPVDVASIVAAAKNPEVTAIEARLAEIHQAEREACEQWNIFRDAADPAFRNYGVHKTDETMNAAAEKRDAIMASRNLLSSERADLQTKLASLNPTSLAAVRAALAPVRQGAAQDMRAAVDALYSAMGRYNATSEQLRANGGDDYVVPRSIPMLDFFVEKAAKS